MEVDAIIVGLGLGSALVACEMHRDSKRFVIFDNAQQSASHIAAGVYNPVVLKRFNLIWEHYTQMREMQDMFSSIEKFYNQKLLHSLALYRIIHHENESKTWEIKAQQPGLNQYMQDDILSVENPFLNTPHGVGEVKGCGYVDIKMLLELVKRHHATSIRTEQFMHSKLQSTADNTWRYDDLQAKHVIFAEGVQVKNNPYFSWVPIEPNKGEVLTLEIQESIPGAIWKKKCFLMPRSSGEYYVGSTYQREFDDDKPSIENKEYLQNALSEFFTGSYTIVKHQAALRPTIRDRKPIIGEHPAHPGLYCLNGLGTRGTLNGPFAVNRLLKNIFQSEEIPAEMNVQRFYPPDIQKESN
ncbi:MAG: FAD-dependent oxidoreductase [Weeksellaceae bacterium]|nr:FAD-dependent oxidoreductase [Weeksellaceae bacterium]